MKLGIMQPYFFPYIGYFQLINAVDEFVIYDDVNYIKQGWINRNRIIVNKREYFFSIDLIKASSFKKINEIEVLYEDKKIFKTLKSFKESYKKAPFFNDIYPIVEESFLFIKSNRLLSNVIHHSLKNISDFLEIKTNFHISSEVFSESEKLGRTERLINICEKVEAKTYINPIGGEHLYDKKIFKQSGIDLLFLEPKMISYNHFNDEFIPGLSIIDVLMFNSRQNVILMLENYSLI